MPELLRPALAKSEGQETAKLDETRHEPGSDWAPLWKAPFYCFSERYIHPKEEWIQAVTTQVNTIASTRDSLDFDLMPEWNRLPLPTWSINTDSKRPEVTIAALRIWTTIAPGSIYVRPEDVVDVDDLDFPWLIFGHSDKMLEKSEWDGIYGCDELAAEWHRRLLTRLFWAWHSDFVSAVQSGAAYIMARKSRLFAPFERVAADQWQLFRLDEDKEDDQNTRWHDPRRPWWSHRIVSNATAREGTGERLFAIHIAPGQNGATSGDTDNPEEQCLHWLMKLLQEFPDRQPRPLGQLAEEALALFPGLTRRGFQRCYFHAQLQTGNRNWSRNRRPPKSSH
jgi:hypothetical protein